MTPACNYLSDDVQRAELLPVHRSEPRRQGRWPGLSADIPLYLILAANIAILVASIGIAGWHVVPVRLNPMLGPPQEDLLRVGAVDASRVARQHQLWRVLTSPFVNAGVRAFPLLTEMTLLAQSKAVWLSRCLICVVLSVGVSAAICMSRLEGSSTAASTATVEPDPLWRLCERFHPANDFHRIEAASAS